LPSADRKDEPRQLPASTPVPTVLPLPEPVPPELELDTAPPELELDTAPPELEPDVAPLELPCPLDDASGLEPASWPPLHAASTDTTVREKNAPREA
jgi:fused signal recognition particle receptor